MVFALDSPALDNLQTLQANSSIIRFLQGRMTDPTQLQPALNNPFFRDTAELYLMRTLLLRELNARQGRFAPQFVQWAAPFIKYAPIPQLYIDLSRAYLATGKNEQAVQTIEDGQARYPKNNALNQSVPLIKKAAGITPAEVHSRSESSAKAAASITVSATASAAAPVRQPETPVQ